MKLESLIKLTEDAEGYDDKLSTPIKRLERACVKAFIEFPDKILSEFLTDHAYKMQPGFIAIIRENYSTIEKSGADLTLYKFKVLMAIRGPKTIDTLIDNVTEHYASSFTQTVARHKSFPQEAKDVMFEKTEKIEYLHPNAQDIFFLDPWF